MGYSARRAGKVRRDKAGRWSQGRTVQGLKLEDRSSQESTTWVATATAQAGRENAEEEGPEGGEGCQTVRT